MIGSKLHVRTRSAAALSVSFALAGFYMYGYHGVTYIALTAAALVTGCLLLASSRRDGLLTSLVLPVKFLMVLDLAFAVATHRPLRYLLGSDHLAERMHISALYLLAIWLLAFVAAFLLSPTGSNMWIGLYRPSAKAKKSHFVLFLAGQAAFAAIIIVVGGLARMIAEMSDRYDLYFGIGFLRVIVAFGGIYACHLFLLERRKLSLLIGFIVFVELSFLGGRSYALFSTIIPLAMLWVVTNKRLPLIKLALLAPAILCFVIGLGAYRSGQQDSSYRQGVGIMEKVAEDTGAADNFPSLLALMEKGAVGFDGSAIVLSSIVAPVPRILWPDKPVADEAAYVGTILTGASEVNWGLPIGPHGLAYFTGGALIVPLFAVISAFIAVGIFALARKRSSWMPFAPCVLLLAPDALSPAIFARVFVFFLLGAVFQSLTKPARKNETLRS